MMAYMKKSIAIRRQTYGRAYWRKENIDVIKTSHKKTNLNFLCCNIKLIVLLAISINKEKLKVTCQTLKDCTNVHSRIRMVYPCLSSLINLAVRKSFRKLMLMVFTDWETRTGGLREGDTRRERVWQTDGGDRM